jgi:hypothetical protein
MTPLARRRTTFGCNLAVLLATHTPSLSRGEEEKPEATDARFALLTERRFPIME